MKTKEEIKEAILQEECDFCCANCNPYVTYANAKTLECFRFRQCQLCGRIWNFEDLNPEKGLEIFFRILNKDKINQEEK